MARVTGPLFSLAATGSLAGVINAASFRGRAYVRKHAVHRAAWTAEQRSHYARLSFAQAAWKTLNNRTPTGMQAEWQPLADELNLTRYLAFVKTGYARWSTTNCPRITPTGGGTGTFNILISAVTGGKNHFGLLATRATDNTSFGIVIYFRAGASPLGNLNEIGLVLPNWYPGPQFKRCLITHVPPGTYNLRWKTLNTNGTLSSFQGSANNRIVT